MSIKVLSPINPGGYVLPTQDGLLGQILTTDGSGAVSFQNPAPTNNFYLTGLSFNTASGVLTATVSGSSDVTVNLDGRYALSTHTHSYDNYQSWNLRTNGVQRTTIQSGGILDLTAGSSISLAYGAGGVVTIASTDTLATVTARGATTSTNITINGVPADTPAILAAQNYARISLGAQGSTGDAHFGASGNGSPTIGLQDYGFYAAHNAYRSSTGAWKHTRLSTIPAVRLLGSGGASGGNQGFSFDYSANVGAADIAWTNLMRITSSGNVGIGTTSPVTKLQVAGGSISIDADQPIRKAGDNSIIGYSSTLPGINIGSGTATDMVVFNAGGVERIRVNTLGNVGIGTTSPSYKLDVIGDIRTQGWFYATSQGIKVKNGSAASPTLGFADDGDMGIYRITTNTLGFSTAAAERMRIDNAGNVGIGTTAPGAKLQVSGNTYMTGDTFGGLSIGEAPVNYAGWNRQLTLNGTSHARMTVKTAVVQMGVYAHDNWQSVSSTAPGGYVGTYNSYPLSFLVNAVSRMVIDTYGNVGIGTTSPGSGYAYDIKLDIVAPQLGGIPLRLIRDSSAVNYGAMLALAAKNSASEIITYGAITGGIIDSTDGSEDGYVSIRTIKAGVEAEKVRVDESGNIGIGTTTPEAKLHIVSGSGQAGFLSRGTNGDTWFPYSNGQNYVRGVTNFDSGSAYFTGGNVGIGTASPGAKLHIAGTIRNSFSSGVGGINYLNIIDGISNGFQTTVTSGNAITYTFNNGANAAVLNIVESGAATFSSSVTAGSQLSILGSDGSGKKLYFTGGTTKYNFMIAAQENVDNTLEITPSSAAGGSTFSTPAVVINSSGNVGIGTTAPTFKLEVEGSIGVKRIGVAATSTIDMQGNFNFDANSGYSHVFKQAGSELARILPSGNVGIGTTSPGAKLEINDTNKAINTKGNLFVSTTDALAIDKGGQISLGGVWSGTSQIQFAGIAGRKENATSGSAGGYLQLSTTNSAGGNLTERMRITSGGNVGIGTTSPSYKLEVQGDFYTNGTNGALTTASSQSNLYLLNLTRTSTSLITAGSVGIGTTSPSQKLEVNGNAIIGGGTLDNPQSWGKILQVQNTGSNGAAISVKDSNKEFNISTYGSKFYISEGVDERITITSTGNVGIGTTTPAAKFQVTDASSSITLQNYLNGAAIFLDGVNGDFIGGDYFHILADGSSYLGVGGYAGGSTPLNVSNSGKVGIGTTAPEQKLHVEGTIQLGNTENLAWAYDNGSYYNYITNTYDTSTGMTFRAGSWTSSNNVDFSFQTYYGGSWSTKLAIKGDGNVGIGTTSPAYKLDISGQIRVDNGVGNGSGQALIVGGSGDVTLTSGGSLFFGAYDYGNSTYIRGYDNSAGLYFYADGTLTMNVAGNGNVGIGTTSPEDRLHIAGGHLLLNNGIELRSKDTGGSVRTIARVNSSTNDLEYGWSGAGAVKFMGGGAYTERMRIHTDGNVGIGTTAPASKLHVVGSATPGNYAAYIHNASGGGNVLKLYNHDWDATDYLLYATNGGTATLGYSFVVDGQGKVGIGTTSPKQKLIVEGTLATKPNGVDGYYSYLRSNWAEGDAFELGISEDGASNFHKLITSSNYYYGSTLQFWTSDTEKMRITSSGNVGIGTTSPSAKLDVAGDIRTSGTGGLNIDASTNFGDNSGGGLSILNLGSTRALRILGTSNNGWGNILLNPYGANVGIGTTNPTYKLDVNGAGRFGADTYKVLSISDAGGAGWGTVGGASIAPQLYMYNTGANAIVQTYINNTARLEVTNTGAAVAGTISIINANISNQELAIPAGTTTVATVSSISYSSVVIDYVVKKGLNLRSGTIVACHDGTNVVFTETSTPDLGITSDITFAMNVSGADFKLEATTISTGWLVKTLVRAL